jgi:hypothetical protein
MPNGPEERSSPRVCASHTLPNLFSRLPGTPFASTSSRAVLIITDSISFQSTSALCRPAGGALAVAWRARGERRARARARLTRPGRQRARGRPGAPAGRRRARGRPNSSSNRPCALERGSLPPFLRQTPRDPAAPRGPRRVSTRLQVRERVAEPRR